MSTADDCYMAALEILLSKSMRGQVPGTHVDIVFERVFKRKPHSANEVTSTVVEALRGRRAAMVVDEGLIIWRQS